VWIKRENTFEQYKTYTICTYGSGELGPKVKRGDGQAPEGFYLVTPKRMNPLSDFHLSFDFGYPNEYDRVHKRTGSALMVHGNCVSIGCYAMTDPVIEEIYALADAALRREQHFFKVHIFPFRITDESMRKHRSSDWIEFWRNLKEGHDYFEKKHIPPNVRVWNQRYIF
jgi:murein L,D-transpeptidase YafK